MTVGSPANVVMHGVELAGTLANRPFKAGHGQTFFAENLQRLLVKDDNIESFFAADGRALYDSDENLLADRFHQDTLDAVVWAVSNGSDAQAVDPVITANELVAVSGDVGNDAADKSILSGQDLYLKASDGKIRLRTRLKIDVITDAFFFFGVTDVETDETSEVPITLSGTTFTTNATDACGFLFDTAATTDNIWCAGVATDVDATEVDSTIAPVAATFLDLAIDIDTAGEAKFYINGTLRATLTGAVATGVDLTPILVVSARTTSSRTVTAAYMAANQD